MKELQAALADKSTEAKEKQLGMQKLQLENEQLKLKINLNEKLQEQIAKLNNQMLSTQQQYRQQVSENQLLQQQLVSNTLAKDLTDQIQVLTNKMKGKE